MRRPLLAIAVLGAVLGTAAPAHAESSIVSMGTSTFFPRDLDVLTADTVVWRNNSQRTHNVKFETEGFDSGRVAPRLAASHQFSVAGVYPYICTIHDGMKGQVGVYPLLLSGPSKRIRRGTAFALHVRAPENAGQVRIEADSGSGFVPVAVAGPAVGGGHEGHDAPGTVHANLVATETATYRAAFSGGVSQELRVEVTDAPDLTARVRRAKHGRSRVTVSADPALPGGRIVVKLKLRERFGWWPVARARLNKRSRATLTIRGHAGTRLRAVLVGRDWATELSKSRTLRLPRR
jgi:plastocyanin